MCCEESGSLLWLLGPEPLRRWSLEATMKCGLWLANDRSAHIVPVLAMNGPLEPFGGADCHAATSEKELGRVELAQPLLHAARI